MSTDCLFCKIISGDLPANIVTQSENALAFRDINPQAPTHVLVIPKIHIESTRKINLENNNYLLDMVSLAQQVVEDEGIAKRGYRWVLNTGRDGGQTVDHIHLHILGGRGMAWPPG